MMPTASNPAYHHRLLALLVMSCLWSPSTLAQAGDQDAAAPADTATTTEPAEPSDPVEPGNTDDPLVEADGEVKMPAKPLLKDDLSDKQRPAEQLDDMPDFGSALIRMMTVLVGMIVLMLVLSKVLPRWLSRRGPSVGKRMRVVDRMQIEPGRSLLVVYVGGKYLLMASDSEGLRLVAQDAIDQDALREAFDAEAGESQKKSGTFSTLLNASRAVGGDEAAAPRAGKEAST